jgi:hypothetical protein
VILLVGKWAAVWAHFRFLGRVLEEGFVMAQAIQNAIDTRDACALRELAQKTSNEQRMMLQFLAEILEGERAFSRARN